MLKTIQIFLYIGRYHPKLGSSKWKNPFKISDRCDRKQSIKLYRKYLKNKPNLLDDIESLRGKTLCCWCKPKECHGDVLVEILEE